MNRARCIIAGSWFICASAIAQPTEIDLSAYTQTPVSDIERFEETSPVEDAEQAPPVQAQSPVPALGVESTESLSPFFGMPQAIDPYQKMEQQRLLLEQFGAVATLLREIKELGNDAAVLAMLEAHSGDAETAELFRALFETIKPTSTSFSSVIPAGAMQATTASAQSTIEPVRPRVVHPIVPVFAQVAGVAGTTEKVVVSIDGTRFIRLPGETIEHEGRRILVESIEASDAEGRNIISIWLIENDRRFQLTW